MEQYQPRFSSPTKIIAFHYGGGNKYSFRPLERLLPEGYQWTTVELPGRGNRIREELLDDVNEMVENIYGEVVNQVQNSEYIVYGHSMGTLIGFELVRKLAANKQILPRLLFFTGRGAPSIEKEKKISGYEKERFWQEIREIGGLPEEIFEQKDLMDFFEPILRKDFQSLEDYRYVPLAAPLAIPIFVRVGAQEDIKDENIEAWQKETVLPLNVSKLPGNHFFIFNHPQVIVNQMIEAHKAVKLMRSVPV